MNIKCNIIQDLLPLYVDGCCSEESCKLIEEHIAECKECKLSLEQMQGSLILAENPVEQKVSENEPSRVLEKGLKKIRRFWIESLIGIVFCVLAGIMFWNQVMERGICFTNIHELIIANAFMESLAEGNYEKAYGYLNVKAVEEGWRERGIFEEEQLSSIEENGRKHFLAGASLLSKEGGLVEYDYLAIHRNDSENYSVEYTAKIGENDCRIRVLVNDNGIRYVHDSEDILDGLDGLSAWSEKLWQEYEGCYFDQELGEYIYFETEE